MIIIAFIILLNVVAIALTYYCLEDSDKKEKLIFIAVGIAVIYMLTSFVYWISTKNIELKQVAEVGKNLITFLFVPINALITLPILAKSYKKLRFGKLTSDHFRNRVIVLAAILLILLTIECSYFKDIQNGVIKMIQKNEVNINSVETNILDRNKLEVN